MRPVILCILILTLILGGPGGVLAYYDKADVPVTIRILPTIIMELDATELVFNEVDFDYLLGAAHLTRVGIVATKGRAVTATISGNVPYTLLISAPEEYLPGVYGGFIHISQLRWRLPGADDDHGWQSITLERVPVRSGPPGTITVPFDFQFMAYWENPAQTYTGQILLTVIPDVSQP